MITTEIKRNPKVKVRQLTEEEREKIESIIKDKVEKLIEPRMSGISYHCEGACGPGCGSETAGACPPCP